MKKKKLYLEEYFSKNNEVRERLVINKKMLFLFIGYFLCSCIYIICASLPSHNFQGDVDITKTVKFYKVVMNVTYLISSLGILLIIVNHFRPQEVRYSIKKSLYNILDWLIILPICVVISTVLFTFVFTVTEVSGESMLPVINNNDQLVLFFDTDVERNDIIVASITKENNFSVPENKNYVKRVIGIPGDKMTLKEMNGMTNIYINGELLEQSFYREKREYGNFNLDKYYNSINQQMKIEEDGSVLFYYMDKDGNTISTYEIPKGYYFILGDNRKNSRDSREIGLVRKDDIIGTVKYRVSKKFMFIWEKM